MQAHVPHGIADVELLDLTSRIWLAARGCFIAVLKLHTCRDAPPLDLVKVHFVFFRSDRTAALVVLERGANRHLLHVHYVVLPTVNDGHCDFVFTVVEDRRMASVR